MSFFRKGERKPGGFDYQRVLVPIVGDDLVDEPALRLAGLLQAGRDDAQVSLLHVIEVPFERNLDAEDAAAVARADELLRRAVALLKEQGVKARQSTVQARAAGPAIVDDANELEADLIVMGLRYKTRFGGQWHAGRTVPYVMRNSTAPVWCLRAPTQELAHTP